MPFVLTSNKMSIHGIGVLVDESMWGIVPNLSMNAMDST